MNDSKKVSLFTKLNYIFDKKQKGQLVILAVLILIGGVFETLGVSMILPVVSVILSPDDLAGKIGKLPWLKNFLDSMGLTNSMKLTCALLILLI